MKKHSILALTVCAVLAALVLSSCGSTGDTTSSSTTAETLTTADYYSYGLSDTGYFEDITASDYVASLCDYENVSVPADEHTVTDEEVDSQISSIMDQHSETTQVTDRAVEDGDTVNIDYVGKIDGVEFDGGSTSGEGTDVTIGETQYIDDFLEQLIGHMPGETFDIEVTFPDPYEANTDLSGKDAVFTTTINYIEETTTPELTDDFVMENFFSDYGWNTVAEMRTAISDSLETSMVDSYIKTWIVENSSITSIPDEIIQHEESYMMGYLKYYADMYGEDIDTFVSSQYGYSTASELIAAYESENQQYANYDLIVQAVAEDAGITVSESDLESYFTNDLGVTDYSAYNEMYGTPYLMKTVLEQKVIDMIREGATLE
ncbi:MAG: trigger factor [Oscillospiraceae bacterium]|jgi:trigger factor